MSHLYFVLFSLVFEHEDDSLLQGVQVWDFLGIICDMVLVAFLLKNELRIY